MRIDPYLRATVAKHPALEAPILAEAARLMHSRECLIHGDYSPKNILFSETRLVPLDCEVACYADAAFDLSFFLNHLCMKALYHASQDNALTSMLNVALTGYRETNSEYADTVERRIAILLPMLMLARVDGKSPVEYLNAEQQAHVRAFASEHILTPCHDLEHLLDKWLKGLPEVTIL